MEWLIDCFIIQMICVNWKEDCHVDKYGQIHFGCLDGALGKEAIRAVIDGKNTAIWKIHFASWTNTFGKIRL